MVIIFYSEQFRTKEVAVKLLKMIKHTLRIETCSKAIKFCFNMQYNNFDDIENGGGRRGSLKNPLLLRYSYHDVSE